MFEAYVGNEIGKFRMQEAERKATENWRYREIKTPAAKVATAILTGIVSFLVH